MKYDWDLIERLLHEVQNTAEQRFAPRVYAEELAAESEHAGHHVDDLDAFKAEATKYEAQLLKADFIAPRPESQGGNGENFVLTDRGLQLLSMIDSSFPGEQHPREVLDSYGLAALTPEVFDKIAAEVV
ncbi:transcriptional regulator [Pseudomonas leptonychotis]|uniref:Transcriptional regulator n=1 Tax=Pseudomonas leptonychotis TaxID=2448482 RepID=A0A4T1ZY54_9PSED|nr:transcriptional regulator [Pseudomonas leptonychotis]TIH08569.1 transcriptional regulator [Pseudomonas leptonychotis]